MFSRTYFDDVISISRLPSGEEIVGSSTCLSSDFRASASHLVAFAKALEKSSVKAKGSIEIKPDRYSVEAFVDGVSVIKFSFYNETNWIVGSSCSLPADIARAKAYVSAMTTARSFVVEKMKANNEQKILEKRRAFVNDYSKYKNDVLVRVIDGSIDNEVVFSAEQVGNKWEFSIVSRKTDDMEWIEVFAEVSKLVIEKAKTTKL